MHDLESARPRPGDTKRLIAEDPYEKCYADCYTLGYLGRPLPRGLVDFKRPVVINGVTFQRSPFVDAWESGRDWLRRDSASLATQLRTARRPYRPPRRGTRRRRSGRGFWRTFIRRIG